MVISASAAPSAGGDDLQRLQSHASSQGYREAALEVLLAEANRIACDLELPEKLPIQRSDLSEVGISTPFWSDHSGGFGFLSTTNYYYYANQGNRLASIVPNFEPDDTRRPAYMESLKKRYLLPKAQMDTNAAYVAATQWLAKAGVDLQALERDAQWVEISAWEIGGKFVPLYRVRWRQLGAYRAQIGPPEPQSIAGVEFLAPEHRLLQMDVNQEKYLKRKPLTVPGRDGLLQQADDAKLRELWFTTEPYKAAALNAMLKEVNWLASALRLREDLPIGCTNITYSIIGTPFAADRGYFATVRTANYAYHASEKMSSVRRYRCDGEEERFIASLRTRYALPKDRLSTRAAYSLATQWLAAASVDLKRLEADYSPEVNPMWISETQFCPLYTVEWAKRIEGSRTRHVAAKVEVLEPERSLQMLSIERPEYMARARIVVPDREKLLKSSGEQ
jgi:hypothetical protein